MMTHGRVGTYVRGCRCEACRSTWAHYQRRYRELRGQRTPPEDSHGTYSTYVNWRCRCELCLEAACIANAERRLARVEPS